MSFTRTIGRYPEGIALDSALSASRITRSPSCSV